jgi:hypothetical protein
MQQAGLALISSGANMLLKVLSVQTFESQFGFSSSYRENSLLREALHAIEIMQAYPLLMLVPGGGPAVDLAAQCFGRDGEGRALGARAAARSRVKPPSLA